MLAPYVLCMTFKKYKQWTLWICSFSLSSVIFTPSGCAYSESIGSSNSLLKSYVYWTVHHCDSWRIRNQLDVTSYKVLLHFFYAQHVSDINTSITGACDFFIESPHCSCVLVSMCVGVSVWLGWGGIRVAGWQPATRIHGVYSSIG